MNDRNLLIVDFSNQVYKAAAAHPNLSSGGYFTGGLYGMITALCKAIRETKATHVVCCEDRPPYLRKQEDPRYKSDRGEPDEQLLIHASETKVLCKAFFTTIGIPVWGVDRFEYDDLCAYLVDRLRHRFGSIVAMTNDSDLYQLFRVLNFSVFRGKTGFYTRASFDADYNRLDPDDWKHVLSMAGSHNCVKGVKGVGFVTAARILRDPVKLREFKAQHGNLMARNLRLVELPHPEFHKAINGYDQIPLLFSRLQYDERKLIRFCAVYDIKFTTDMRESFTRVCES